MSPASGPPERVLLLHEMPGGYGGAERYLQLLGAGLVERGVQATLLVFEARTGLADRLVEQARASGVRTVVHQGRARPGPIRAEVRRDRPDVLHWSFVDPYAFQGAAWLLLPWGVPSVITDHLPMLGAGPHRRLTRALANRRMAAAVVVGEAGAEAMASRWGHAPRTVVVPNGVRPVPPERRRPTAPAAQPARLLFLGRLTDQKGVLDLPAVVAGLERRGRPAHLTVVGDGPQRAELVQVAEQEAPGHVELLGFADDPVVAFAAADLLVAPSRWEGLPFTPLEALAAGLPVLLSDIPPHRELADGGQAVHLAPIGRMDEWVASAERALDGLPGAGPAAVAVADRRSADAMVVATLAVYREAMGSSSA